MASLGVSYSRNQGIVLQNRATGADMVTGRLIGSPTPTPREWIFSVPDVNKVLFSIQRQAVSQRMCQAQTPLIIECANQDNRPLSQVGKRAGALSSDEDPFPFCLERANHA